MARQPSSDTDCNEQRGACQEDAGNEHAHTVSQEQDRGRKSHTDLLTCTIDMVADIGTKALDGATFTKLRDIMTGYAVENAHMKNERR